MSVAIFTILPMDFGAYVTLAISFPGPNSSNLAICGTLTLVFLAGRKFFKC